MESPMQTPQEPTGLAEIRAHLTAALELLDNMGASDAVNPKTAAYNEQMNGGPG